MSTKKYYLKKINRDTKLYKTTEYDCDSIFDYMKLERNQPCKTNKMIWLSESEERAKFYGNQIKIFNVDSEIYLWKLMEEPYSFFLDNYVDNEFKGQMQVLLRLFGEGETLKDQAKTLFERTVKLFSAGSAEIDFVHFVFPTISGTFSFIR